MTHLSGLSFVGAVALAACGSFEAAEGPDAATTTAGCESEIVLSESLEALPAGFQPVTSGGRLEFRDGALHAFVELAEVNEGFAYVERIYDVPPKSFTFEVMTSIPAFPNRYVEPGIEITVLGAEDLPRTQLYFHVYSSSDSLLRFAAYKAVPSGEDGDDQGSKRSSEILRNPFDNVLGAGLDMSEVPANGTVRMGDSTHIFTTEVPTSITRVRVRTGIMAAARADGRAEPIEIVVRNLSGRICPR